MFERDENSNEKPRQLGRGKVADIARIGRIEFSVEPNTLPGWQNLHATQFPFVSAQKTQLTKPLPPPTARLHFADGRISTFRDQTLAYQTWLSLPRGVRAAFRGQGDNRPVYPWDFANQP